MCFRTTDIVVTFVLLNHLLRRGTGKGASATVGGLVKLRPGAIAVVISRKRTIPRSSFRHIVPVRRVHPKSVILIGPKRQVTISNVIARNDSCMSRDVLDNRPMTMSGRGSTGIFTNAVGRGKDFHFQTRGVNASALLTGVVRVIRSTRKDGTPIRRLISGVTKVFIPAVVNVTILTFVT